MDQNDRISHLEDEIEYLQAIIDGSEAQTREAIVTMIGLVFSLLKKKDLIDYDETISFMAESVDADRQAEDHSGTLIHDLCRILEFHRSDETGTLERHVPIEEISTPEEIAAIGKRAQMRSCQDKTRKKIHRAAGNG